MDKEGARLKEMCVCVSAHMALHDLVVCPPFQPSEG